MSGRGAFYKAKYGGGRHRQNSSSESRQFFKHHDHFGETVHSQNGFASAPQDDQFEMNSDLDDHISYQSDLSRGTLLATLTSLDKKTYSAYKSLRGCWSLSFNAASLQNTRTSQPPSLLQLPLTVIFDHIQPDVYAPPSQLRVQLSQSVAQLPAMLFNTKNRHVALEDFLLRRCFERLRPSSNIKVTQPSQCILQRSAVAVSEESVELRCCVTLPAWGRRINGPHAAQLIVYELAELVVTSFWYALIDPQHISDYINCVEDQMTLIERLPSLGLAAFVANGSVLPRKSGTSDLPLCRDDVVRFQSPPSLSVTVILPHRGSITGMGIKTGVTLIVGGGFHGKSTLLESLQYGFYAKVPGDGREFVCVGYDTVKIRAEDGRRASRVDLRAFIKVLPSGYSTEAFTTDDASGSTSQAVNMIEALELGARTLLLDEDTGATNFMIRDPRMQALVHPDDEPVTPFTEKVRPLYSDLGVSTILVTGSSGDYFSVADTVIQMLNYQAFDVTLKAHKLSGPLADRELPSLGFGTLTPRYVDPVSIMPDNSRKVKVLGLRGIAYGTVDIELDSVETFVEVGQMRSVALSLQLLSDLALPQDGSSQHPLRDLLRKRLPAGHLCVRAALEMLESLSQTRPKHQGHRPSAWLDTITRRGYPEGSLSGIRRYELGCALNRLRTLRVITPLRKKSH